MKTSFFVLGLALLWGCHSGNVGTAGASGNAGDNWGTPGPTFSLRIKGTDLGDYRRAKLDVATVQVRGPNGVLATRVMTTEIDLAAVDQAWLLSSFQVPAGIDDVEFVVSFAGGQVVTAKGAFDVDAACSTLRITGKVQNIAQRKHAVIQMDVARSVVAGGAGWTLVPHYQLVY